MVGETAYGLVPDAALVLADGQIRYCGPKGDLPKEWHGLDAEGLDGRLVTPALIDCHTHLIFGGNRALEFEMRLQGRSYEDIARAGGGINSTVQATRQLTEDQLVETALPRLNALTAEGVATVEIKSGYGLTIADELKMLRAARRLQALSGIRICTTYLAAHTTPPEYKGRAGDYISEVVLPGMTAGAAEGLIDAVDAFCENIAFSTSETRTVFEHARLLGLPVKLHAEQLSDQGGAALAAEFAALSADHLEYLSPAGIAAMAAAGTVAVLLPGAFYTLRETMVPPVEGMRAAGVPMALASDCNPGTSPITSLLLTMNMAATLFRMTPEEALAGATRNAALALGLQNEIGTVEAGKRAELAVWSIEHPAELAYRIGFNPLHSSIIEKN
nr:imidazolonepropionase [Aureimonas fodinaquatilis]